MVILEPLESRCLLSANPSLPDLLVVAPVLDAPYASAAVEAPMAEVTGHGAAKAPGGGRDDYGNDFGSAHSVTLSGTGAASVNGKIETLGDIDMFRVVATVTGELTVWLKAGGGKSTVDPYLTLYDDGKRKIGENDDANSGTHNACVTIDVESGHAYYVAASGDNSTVGSYSLQISTEAAPLMLPGPDDYSAGDAPGIIRDGQVLVVLGTGGDDTMTLSQSGNVITVVAGGQTQTAAALAGLAIYGFGGNDTIRETSSMSAALITVIYAGAGADTVYQNGPDRATVHGQDGDDLLVTVGGGADTLYGGTGTDRFWVDSSDTLSDVQPAETAAKSVHTIAAFTAPTKRAAVSLEIAGQDMIDPRASYAYTNNFVTQPLFADGPEYNDIRQGAVGDCYFLAGVSALAQTDPGYLSQAITALGDGTYAVRFFRNGQEYYYRIDAQLPTYGGSPAYAKLTTNDGELWVALLEKAFCQFRTGQNSYNSISGGYLYEAYTAIAGAGYSWHGTSGDLNALGSLMKAALDAGHAVTAGSLGDNYPIIGNHAYEVHAVDQDADGTWYVTVYNPWGYDGVNGQGDPNDGLIRLTVADFQVRFGEIDICNA